MSENTTWAKSAEVIASNLEWTNDLKDEQLITNLKAALVIGEVHEGLDIRKQLSSREGRDNILHHLYNYRDNNEIAPLCVLLSILYNPSANTGRGNGNSTDGLGILIDILDNPEGEDHAHITEEVVRVVRELQIVRSLAEEANTTNDVKDFVGCILRQIADVSNALTHLDSRLIFEFPDVIVGALEEEMLCNLVEKLARKGELQELMKKRGEEEWLQDMKQEGGRLDIILCLVDSEMDLQLPTPYEDALLSHVEEVLEQASSPSRPRSDWEKLLEALSKDAKGAFLKRLQHMFLQRADESLSPALNLYSGPLFNSNAIQNVDITDPGVTVNERFTELLKRKDEAELRWLQRVLDSHPDLKRRTNKDVWGSFQDRIVDAFKRANGRVREQLEEIATSIGVSLPEENEPDEEGAGSE